jgi:hypothetical protein
MTSLVREARSGAGEKGAALVVAVLCALLMTALGAALVLTSSSETMIATNFRSGLEGLYAADAAAERAMADLVAVGDWNQVLSGSTRSSFVDGAPGGVRSLPDGTTLDLTQAVNMANCQKLTTCSLTDLNAVTPDRPWGPNNPRWQLYAYGRLAGLLPAGAITSSYYVMVCVGDDASENDADPLHDGADPAVNKGAGILALRAEALGPRGSRSVVEVTIARFTNAVGNTQVRVLSWRQKR